MCLDSYSCSWWGVSVWNTRWSEMIWSPEASYQRQHGCSTGRNLSSVVVMKFHQQLLLFVIEDAPGSRNQESHQKQPGAERSCPQSHHQPVRNSNQISPRGQSSLKMWEIPLVHDGKLSPQGSVREVLACQIYQEVPLLVCECVFSPLCLSLCSAELSDFKPALRSGGPPPLTHTETHTHKHTPHNTSASVLI